MSQIMIRPRDHRPSRRSHTHLSPRLRPGAPLRLSESQVVRAAFGERAPPSENISATLRQGISTFDGDWSADFAPWRMAVTDPPPLGDAKADERAAYVFAGHLRQSYAARIVEINAQHEDAVKSKLARQADASDAWQLDGGASVLARIETMHLMHIKKSGAKKWSWRIRQIPRMKDTPATLITVLNGRQQHSTFLVRDDDSGRVEEAHNIVPAGGWSFGAGDEVMVSRNEDDDSDDDDDDYGSAWMRARVTQAHRDGSFSVQYEVGRRRWGVYAPFSHRDANDVKLCPTMSKNVSMRTPGREHKGEHQLRQLCPAMCKKA